MPVAERLYYDDPFARAFTAHVSDIREFARKDGQSQWQIALDRTAFYPTTGGQPHDRGTLSALARSGAALTVEVDDVTEDEDGEVWHATRKPLLAGTEVRGVIDWPRRMDHIQQHSGQHLLSAIFAEQHGALTVSFHLGESVSTIDLTAAAEEQAGLIAALSAVEQQANQHIAEDLPVSIRTVDALEAQALLAEGRVRKLPPRGGAIRLIEIAGLDLNACGGTHVRSLGQIGGLLVRGSERTKQGLRVEFLCGARAIAAARHDWMAVTHVAGLLSTRSDDAPAAVERLLAENKQSAKTQVRLRQELAHHQAVQLAVEERIVEKLRMVQRSFADRDGEYVKLLASSLVRSVPQTVAIFLSTMEDPAALVLACSASLPCECGARLKAALAPHGLRGGGSADMAQTLLPRALGERIANQLREQITAELRQIQP